MSIVDLIELPGLGDPQISPDGSQLLYSRTDADWDENGTRTHVWRVDMDGSGSLQLTNGAKGESGARWSPDGGTIAFVATRDESEHAQIHLISNAGGEARPLTDHPTQLGSIEWAPDGEWIYFVAQQAPTDAEKARAEVNDNVFRYEEDRKMNDLWRVNVASGETVRVSSGDMHVRGYSISRDGSRVLLQLAPTPLFDDQMISEIWMTTADGSAGNQITDNQVGEVGASLSPDNSRALFVANTSDAAEDFYYNQRLFVVSTEGGAPRSIVPGGGYDVSSARWSADGSRILFSSNMGVRQQIFSVDPDAGDVVQVTHGDHAIFGWDYEPAVDRLVFSINSPTNAGDLWTLRGSTGTPTQVTHALDYLAEEFFLPRVESVRWNGEDGVEVEGLVYYPIDYQEGTRYPVVVQTHGGPPASDKFGFSRSGNYEAVLAARGFVVFKPNYRGSTGYGDEFLRNMVGHYFDQAHKDVMAGVDHIIDLGLVDGDRMAKMGWSAGGHMTNKIITYTDRFKAASSGAGAVNWMSMYAQSDVRIYRTPWFGGTPWSEDAPIEQYMADSPLFDLHKVTTPTIVLVGENDNRVPMPQSVELYQGLKHNGVPTHLYVAPKQGHGWRELQQRLFKANVELDWFYKWVLEEDYEWERSPVHPDEKKSAVTTAGG